MNTSVESYSVWVCAKTKHGSMLEFVLKDADDRNYGDRDYISRDQYTQFLWDMTEKELKNSKADIEEVMIYGDVSFRLIAPTLSQLERAIKRFDKVVGRWLNKYRIHQMKERK